MYKWQRYEIKLARAESSNLPNLRVKSARSIARLFLEHAQAADRESLWVLALDSGNILLGIEEVYRGTSNECHVRYPEVLRMPLVLNASSFVIVHNHPTGRVEASSPDLDLARDLYRYGDDFGIELLDSVIVGPKGKHFSIRKARAGTSDPIWHNHIFPGPCWMQGELCTQRDQTLEKTA
jgi:DNA repair protein RadC